MVVPGLFQFPEFFSGGMASKKGPSRKEVRKRGVLCVVRHSSCANTTPGSFSAHGCDDCDCCVWCQEDCGWFNTHCCLLGRAWVSRTLVWIVHVCVSIYACLLAARTINIKWLSISWRSTLWSMWRPVQGSVRVQCGQLKLNHMWQLDFWFVLLPTINGRLLTGGTNLIWAVVEVASGKGHA